VKRCAIYVRVSTEEQAREGFSVRDQISRLRRFASEQGWDVEVFVDEGYSGKDMQRPGLQRLIDAIVEGRVDVLLISDIDRLSRNIRDQEDIKELLRTHGVELWKPYEKFDILSADGDFTVSLLGILAQRERRKIAERVLRGMKRRALEGRWNGGDPPFGYTLRRRIFREALAQGMSEEEALELAVKRAPQDKMLYVDEQESKVVKLIFELYLDEDRQMGFGKIAEYLNTHGYRGRRGALWSAATVRDLISNPVYCGLLRWNRFDYSISAKPRRRRRKEDMVLVKGVHPPIIDEASWRRAQEKRERNRREVRGRSDYLLSGMIFCGKCGSSMIGTSEGRKGSWRGYRCCGRASFGKSFCDARSVNKERVEEAVLEEVKEVLLHPEHVMEVLEGTKTKADEVASKLRAELEEKERELENLRGRLSRWYDAFESGLLDVSQVSERVAKLREDIASVEAERDRLSEELKGSQLPPPSYEQVRRWLEEIGRYMESGQKRALLRSLNTRVTVLAKDRLKVRFEIGSGTEEPKGPEELKDYMLGCSRRRTSADKPCVAYRVVGGPEGPRGHEGGVRREDAGYRVDLGGREGLLQGHLGKDRG